MASSNLVGRIRNHPQPPAPALAISKVVVCIIPIAQIAIGAKYLHECPHEHYIPIYLIVVGVFGLILSLLSCLPCARESEEGASNPLSKICIAWNSLTSVFLFCWFIAAITTTVSTTTSVTTPTNATSTNLTNTTSVTNAATVSTTASTTTVITTTLTTVTTAEPVKILVVKFRSVKGIFTTDLLTSSSKEFRQRATLIRKTLEPFYQARFPSFRFISVTAFSNGSIINNMDIGFALSLVPNANEIAQVLIDAAKITPFDIETTSIFVNDTLSHGVIHIISLPSVSISLHNTAPCMVLLSWLLSGQQ